MNYKVTLSIFLLFVHVRSAIIGGRSRRQDEEKLQDGESIQRERHKNLDDVKRLYFAARAKRELLATKDSSRYSNRNDLSTSTSPDKRKRCTRVYLKPSTVKHNFIVGSSKRLDIHANCQQCRRTQHCTVGDNCLPCAQYCKQNDQELFGRKAVQLKEDILPGENLEDRTFMSRLGGLKEADSVEITEDENNEFIPSQEIDETNISRSRKNNEDHTNEEDLHGSGRPSEFAENCKQCRLAQHCELGSTCLPCIRVCPSSSFARLSEHESGNPSEFTENCEQCRLAQHCEMGVTCLPCIRVCPSSSSAKLSKHESDHLSEFTENCQQCRLAQHCELEGTCLPCIRVCLPSSFTKLPLTEDEGIAAQSNNNTLPANGSKNQPLIPRDIEISLKGGTQEDGVVDGNNKSIKDQAIADTNLPSSRKLTENERDAEEFDDGINKFVGMENANQPEFHGTCEQCRQSQQCTIKDSCLQCFDYCKPNGQVSLRSMFSPEYEQLTRREEESSLDDLVDNQENENTNLLTTRQRVENQAGSDKYHAGFDELVRMEAASQFNVHENCEQCRHSQHCTVSDTCLQCSQYCKPNEPESLRRMSSPDEAIIARNSENHILPARNHIGQSLVTNGEKLSLNEARMTDESRERSIDNQHFDDTNMPISQQRFGDQTGSEKLDTKPCEECRNFKNCKEGDSCLQCLEFCKIVGPRLLKSSDEVGIARDPETHMLPVEDLKDRTLVSRTGEDTWKESGLMENFDNENMAIPRESINEPIDVEEFDNNMVQKTNQGFIDNENHKKKEDKRVENFGEEDEGRYYLLGTINSGLLLNILTRLSGINDHFDIGRNTFDKAIILVKSRNPVHITPGLMQKIGDSKFLRILEKEMNNIEKKQKKGHLTAGAINNIIQIAHEKAEAKYKERDFVKEENMQERQNNENVGCSHEQNEVIPFYSTHPSLYRSKSVSLPENNNPIEIIKPTDTESPGENIAIKHAKNPEVIQDNPSVESRSNSPKLKDMSNSDKTQTFETISAQLRNLGNMNLLGSTKVEAEKNERYKERLRNEEQFSREESPTENTSSEQESVEENNEARTFHKKIPIKYKGKPYLYHQHVYNNFYRHSSPDIINLNSHEQENFDKPIDKKHLIDTNTKKVSSITRNLNNLKDEHTNFKSRNPPNAVPSRIDSNGHIDNYRDLLSNQDNQSDQQSETNHNDYNKKNPKTQDTFTRMKGSLSDDIERNMNDVKPKKYKQTEKYDRMGEYSSMLENEDPSGTKNVHTNAKIYSHAKKGNEIKEQMIHGEVDGKMENSAKNIESKEPLDHSAIEVDSVNQNIDEAPIYDMGEHKKTQQQSTYTQVDSKSVPQNQMENANENTEMNGKDIPRDEHYGDLFTATKKAIDNFSKASISAEDNIDNEKRLRNTLISDEEINLENYADLPEATHNLSDQKVDMARSNNAELSTDHTQPSKVPFENPNVQSIRTAQAFKDKENIEIDISNYSPSNSPIISNIDSPKDVAPQIRMSEIETSKIDEDPVEIIGDALTENNNDVIDENINKLITSQEREFLHNFGKIVPAAEKLQLGKNSEVYFNGNGIKLPLKVSQSDDGVLTLSVDMEKLCECRNATCSHKKQFLKQLDNNMGKIFHGPQMPIKLHKSQNIKSRRSNDPYDLFEPNRYQITRQFKRSISESSKVNNLGHQSPEIDESKIKIGSKQDHQNYEALESNHEKSETFIKFDSLEKFKKAEKELEEKLEKLNAEVHKSSKYYNNMLQKSTKDLLQIKREDQVVKQRTELVNDLLKWMKDMADRVTTLNKNSTII